MITTDRIEIRPDMDASIEVIRHAGAWLQETKGETSEWWDPEVVSADFLSPHAKPDEFFVAFVDGRPAATAIIQATQDMQDWSSVDGEAEPNALYIHYVATEREFASQGLVTYLMDKAIQLAKERGIPVLRLDTNADEPKLCDLYEAHDFVSVGIVPEEGHRTVLYERQV